MYPDHIGDISFDASIDNPDFKICNPNSVFQYFEFGKGLQYKGEKPKINGIFKSGFKPGAIKNESGYLTIRFIVNCEGRTGWFRLQGMNKEYKEKEFDGELVDKLLTLTKSLDGWIIGGGATNKVDYYQYLTFKLVDGQLIEIMP